MALAVVERRVIVRRAATQSGLAVIIIGEEPHRLADDIARVYWVEDEDICVGPGFNEIVNILEDSRFNQLKPVVDYIDETTGPHGCSTRDGA